MNLHLYGWIMAACLFFSPALRAQSAGEFVVDGALRGASGKKVYLVNAEGSEIKDSSLVKDEHFTFRGKIETPTVFAVFLEGLDNPLLTVLQPHDTLHIDGTAARFPVAEVTGNDQSIAMQQYQRDFQPLIEKAAQLNSQAQGIKAGDSAGIARFRKATDVFNSEVAHTGIAYVRYHPDAIASLFVLMNELRGRMTQAQLDNLLGTLDSSLLRTKYGQATLSYLNRVRTTAIGSPAPDFTLNDVNGKPVSLSSFRGRYVLVDFWASWCGPCRQENPNVVSAYRMYKDRNFTVLGVSLDQQKDNWLRAIRQDRLFWTQVSDLHGWGNEAAQLYHVNSIPANFLVDPQGKIIAKDLRGEMLQRTLGEVLP